MKGQEIFVLKLGGDAVGSETMPIIIERVRWHLARGHRLALVASALRRATPLLRECARLFCAKEDASSTWGEFRALYRGWIQSLNAGDEVAVRTWGYLDRVFADAARASMQDRWDAASTDALLAAGEIAGIRILEAYFKNEGIDCGVVPVQVNGMLTDDRFGYARPLPGAGPLLRSAILPVLDRGQVALIPGFVGHTQDGRTTTVGPSGSDLSAAEVVRALGAGILQVWKTYILHTADPRVVKGALPTPHLHMDDAAELAAHGMGALHPSAMEVLRDSDVVVYVKSVHTPWAPGTRISSKSGSARPSGITMASEGLFTVRSGRMVGATGPLNSASGALMKMGYPVGLIASSQTSFTVSAPVEEAHVATAEEQIRLQCGEGAQVASRGRCSIVTVVGGMKGVTASMLDTVIHALRVARVRIISVSMAAAMDPERCPMSVQVVVPVKRGVRAVNAIHRALYGKPSKRARKTPKRKA
ncbi:aspartate kinase [Patescibacteria group bacterium]|nr:aspartate kinase [Patescibacteria group bacterium]